MHVQLLARAMMIAVLCVAGVALAGCNTLQDMNDELTRLHARQAAQRAELVQLSASRASNDVGMLDAKLMLADTAGDLQALAKRAHMQALDSGNKLTAVAFHRIAAVAAWQAGANEVLDYSKAGEAACASLPGTLSAAPRDCAMLVVIPHLARNDEAVTQLNAINATKPRSERDPQALMSAFKAFDDSLEGLIAAYEKTRQLPLHPVFREALEARMLTVYCNVGSAKTSALLIPRLSAQERAGIDARAAELETQMSALPFGMALEACS